MKIKKFLAFFIFLFCAQTAAFAQTDWMRVMSDNGEFSIEMPSNSIYFFDYESFNLAYDWDRYTATETRMLTAFHEKTLLAVESYRADKGALEIIRQTEARGVEPTEIKEKGYKIKQVVQKTPNFYAVKKFFHSKEFIYVLTAASRSGETPAMKRFFDSFAFNPDKRVPETTPKATAFSKLKQFKLEIEETADKPVSNQSDDNRPPLPNIVDEVSKLVIVSKPMVAFTDSARKSRETGKIRLRVTFAKEGRVSKVVVLDRLGKGLLRQAISVAARMKFLPQERDGEPVTVSRTVEYGFSIY